MTGVTNTSLKWMRIFRTTLQTWTGCIKLVKTGADVAVGSRYVAGGTDRKLAIHAPFIFAWRCCLYKIITWMPVNDPTAGFVCYRRQVLDTINFNEIQFVGYAFQVEMKFAAWKLGFKIVEVPIVFRDRSMVPAKCRKAF